MDKRNERIQATLRPYHIVIRNKLFYSFMCKIFQVDPEERANAAELLNHNFLKSNLKEIEKNEKQSEMTMYKNWPY